MRQIRNDMFDDDTEARVPRHFPTDLVHTYMHGMGLRHHPTTISIPAISNGTYTGHIQL
jgi:hypothetical protein